MNRILNSRPLRSVGQSAVGIFVALLAACGILASASTASAVPMVSDANLLSNKLPTVSSTYNGNYSADNATDGEGSGENKDFVFADSDGNQRMVVNGINSGISIFRLWGTDLRPLHLLLKSSTANQSSLNSGDYETTLFDGTITQAMWSNQGPPSATLSYFETLTNGPVGTQSLYIDFDNGNDTTGNTGFARVAELQAFFVAPPAAPEPSTLWLAAVGLLAIRKRRARQE